MQWNCGLGTRIMTVNRSEQKAFQCVDTGDRLMYSPLKFKTVRDLLFKAPQPFGAVTFLRGTPVPHTQSCYVQRFSN